MPTPWDDRRVLEWLPSTEELIHHAAEQFVRVAQEAIAEHGAFAVALSGGSTPKALYELLSKPPFSKQLDWSRVSLFWGDERAVPESSSDSNYGEAMRAGLASLPIPTDQIHPMRADSHLDNHARQYDQLLREKLPKGHFDLVLLGLGEDGHTASLFPQTKALEEREALCVANWIPEKESWRMTLTYPALARARRTWFLISGESKANIVAEILTDLAGTYPASKIGSKEHPACLMLDQAAASLLPLRG